MNTEVKSTRSESSLTGPLRRAMNAALISVMDLKVEGKPEEISLAAILGNMDASSYLVVFISLAVTLMVGIVSGMLILSIWPNASQIVLIASLPAIVVGFITCVLLFRITRWLKS